MLASYATLLATVLLATTNPANAATTTTTAGGAGTSLRVRRMEAMEYQAAMSAPPRACIIENGFDYVGNDIANAQGSVDTCCDKCIATNGCGAWSWTNLNGGTCWLKSARGTIAVNANVKSALLAWGSTPYCALQSDVDYVGNDLARVNSADASGCCGICQNYAACRAYTWSNYNGGSCWLKSAKGNAVYKAGVKSAEAYPSSFQSCQPLESNVDYVGNDIANKPSATADGCCDVCRSVQGCVAFSWTNQNGGTCYLKNFKGDAVAKPGVISSQVYYNPTPSCSIEADVDYIGNDIANKPASDSLQCCSICSVTSGCKAFTWSDYNGGTCWLKSGKGATANKAGVRSATLS